MKFNLLGKISIIIVSLALLAGCGTALVRDVDSAMISGNHSVANIERAIVRAGTGLGWVMTKKSDKHIVGKLTLRTHLAVIDITYDKNSYSIKYKDSTNLNYDGSKIHTNYNGWIQNLQRSIDLRINTL
ncbi:hypothetical protein [uncultured Gammaproteobacteria bacterium]|jgi:hypothetical protein|uniref:Uncharacterized protein n=3 Tax=sulfur-oxidizing symbionts TaxID=32036 RepID=A0ACA8ZSW8_9GAMM|nr:MULTISPECIES: hypothetical protein [sulfur-oxidizing symbionts]CAC5816740.1 hypothetical protein [uncultured Gammaproteobacteria bacterium]CAB5499438.1 hypothetical protein AZO1586I_492 [Bathymodiolus thermophilus thioautotrophic gill symbiont]CAB5505028.1 hypothetical protein AZO1586R_1855 [Bathymodiolus azoricus thioautotrophic gill symbiont]CAC9473484.1 hypothetical protein [uncultured Gammaproteobacteria bacterium]CAC9497842.1 hypothetical protein [uncultured Gammaproteobacteria bacteri